MLSKFAPRAFTAPVRTAAPLRAAFSPAVARRTVTTDAASSSVDKSQVPDVGLPLTLLPSRRHR